MARVTVVTAAKNAAAFVADTIASIQAQTFQDWDYVVVDDASTDATAEIVELYAAGDARIKLERLDQSVGAYAAANTAMLHANSAYLARLDADDIAVPGRLQRQLDALAAAPHARGCTGAWRAIDEQGADIGTARPVRSHSNAVLKWTFCVRSNLVHSTMLVDTEWFQAFGGYGPERYAEDFRIWGALVREGRLAVVDDVLVRYRMHADQITAAPGVRDQPERQRVRLDHLQRCAPGDWTLEDARDLRYVGRPAPFHLRRGLELLARWDAAWRADATLDAGDRKELAALSGRAYLAQLRQARSGRPREVATEAVRHWPRAVRALRDVGADRTARWE